MVIYIQYKFYAIPSIGYLVMVGDGKIIEIKAKKDKNSAITDDTPIILHVHNLTVVI